MQSFYNDLIENTQKLQGIHKPVFFHLNVEKDKQAFDDLIKNNANIFFFDTLIDQLKELIKGRHPQQKLQDYDYPPLIEKHLNGTPAFIYGVWVYYPWNNKLLHILPENEYVEVRTNRNQYKITPEEQAVLATKKLGVIGLSVGQSIALSLAMERLFGELRLADFDVLELSNMNRIRTGVQNLGLSKVVIAAREIAEIDPYLNVTVYNDGITDDNIEDFLTTNGKLDLLIEVCDGLDVKILSRHKARDLQIPVLMDTSDRGMIDVERFDIEPDRPILHGLAGDLDPARMRGLSNEEKVPYIMQMIGADTMSVRLKASMMEVETTITTWPQLASSVTLGGAVSADVARRIMLGQHKESGRYYVDVEEIIPSTEKKAEGIVNDENPYQPLEFDRMKQIADGYNIEDAGTLKLTKEQADALIEVAHIAPSAGNNQPAKWIITDDVFYLFHDKHRTYSWGDFEEIGANESLGTAIENLNLKAIQLGLKVNVKLFPDKNIPEFTAVITFSENKEKADPNLLVLADNIEQRHTNRKLGKRQPIAPEFLSKMKDIVTSVEGAGMQYVADDENLYKLGEIVSACDRIRLLYHRGHLEFFHEIRWTPWQAQEAADGIDMNLVDLTESERAGFRIAVDWDAVSLLEQWQKGRAFQKMSRKSIAGASAMVLVTMPEFNAENFINAGRAVERGWIYACMNNIAVHPMLSPVFFLNRLKFGSVEMPKHMKDELLYLKDEYEKIFDLKDKEQMFLMKLAITEPIHEKTFRLPKEKVFLIEK